MKTEVDVIEDVEEYQTVPGIITVIMRIIGDPSIVIQSFFLFSVFKLICFIQICTKQQNSFY